MVENPMQYNLSTIAIIRETEKRQRNKRESKTIDTREKKTTFERETEGT